MSRFIDAYRLVTFAPPEYVEELAMNVSARIPEFLGPYDHVAWWSAAGIEQFRPLEGAHPEKGSIGRLTRTPSVRIEFTLPKDDKLLDKIIQEGIVAHHPWEEPIILVFDHRIWRK